MNKTIKLNSIEFSQNSLINKNLKAQHIIILDYLNQFFTSGNAIYKTKRTKRDKYFLITLNKILDDLKFLGIKKRRLQELLSDLETAKIIKRFSKSKTCPVIYIKIDLTSILAF